MESNEVLALRSFSQAIYESTDYIVPKTGREEFFAAFQEQFTYIGQTAGLTYVLYFYQHTQTRRELDIDVFGNPYVPVGNVWVMVSHDAALTAVCS